MKLQELSVLFPFQDWHLAQPSRAVPIALKVLAKSTFGGLFSASDRYNYQTPTRVGITTRPYEHGDPIRALSVPHLIARNAWETKTDHTPGRDDAQILLHCYPNMTYQSTSANKGQTALALAALIQIAHESRMQNTKLFFADQSQLDLSLARLNRLQKTYVISDFLFDTQDVDSALRSITTALTQRGFQRAVLCNVRDDLEMQSSQILSSQGASLQPYTGESLASDSYFSGAQYDVNLKKQDFYLKRLTDRCQGFTVCDQMQLEHVISFVASTFRGK